MQIGWGKSGLIDAAGGSILCLQFFKNDEYLAIQTWYYAKQVSDLNGYLKCPLGPLLHSARNLQCSWKLYGYFNNTEICICQVHDTSKLAQFHQIDHDWTYISKVSNPPLAQLFPGDFTLPPGNTPASIFSIPLASTVADEENETRCTYEGQATSSLTGQLVVYA